METRLTTLETKWDTVIPTLATRTDLIGLEGRLRDEMRQGFLDLQRWLMTAMQRALMALLAAVVLAAGGGVGLVMNQRIQMTSTLSPHASLPPEPSPMAALQADGQWPVPAVTDGAVADPASAFSPHEDNPANDLS